MVRLDVLTLNMQNGQIWDAHDPDKAPIDLDRTIAFLRDRSPDVFFLQEVELPATGFVNRQDHPNYDRLRQAFGDYHSCFAYPANTVPHLPFGIGLAIFSRFPIKDSFHLVLPAADIEFEFEGAFWKPAERSLIGTFIEVAEVRVQLLNTHLQAYFMIESNSDDHPEQRTVIKTVLNKRSCPTILAGDFNCTGEEGTLSDIESTGAHTVQTDQATWLRMPMVLDHIFLTPEFQSVGHQIHDEGISDHCGLSAKLELALG